MRGVAKDFAHLPSSTHSEVVSKPCKMALINIIILSAIKKNRNICMPWDAKVINVTESKLS